MARPLNTHVDPAADAAALLRRLGFATLMVAVPLTALVARRAVVILAPIGIALLVIAAVLDGDHNGVRADLRRLVLSPGGLAGGLLVLWCALSLVWTPFPSEAVERVFNVATTLALAVAGYLALPERMRSANLYLLPLGVGAAALFGLGLALSDALASRLFQVEAQELERGLIVLVMLTWPALAWMRSRGRDLEGLVLAIAVAAAAVLSAGSMPFVALAVGAAAFALTAVSRRVGALVTAGLMAGIVALAPLIPFLARPFAALAFNRGDPTLVSLSVWRRVVQDDPLRLVTGRGFETASRGRVFGMLRPEAPSTLPFEVWYELGLVGAMAGAVALYCAARAAGRAHPALAPGAMAAFASAFAFACLGVGTAQMWWFTTLAAVALIFIAAERGQFRTTRPKASFAPSVMR